MVALVLTWHRLFAEVITENLWLEENRTLAEIYFPGLYLIPITVALLFWSCYMSKYRNDTMSALALIVIAWLLTSYSATDRILEYLLYIGGPPRPRFRPLETQEVYNHIVFSSISLTLFATMPAIYCLWGRFKSPAYQKQILYGSVLFAVADMLLLFYSVSSTFGIFGPYYPHGI